MAESSAYFDHQPSRTGRVRYYELPVPMSYKLSTEVGVRPPNNYLEEISGWKDE